MVLLPQIRSLSQLKPMVKSTAIMIIKTTITITTLTTKTVKKNNDSNNNKNKKSNNSTNEKVVYNEKLQAQLQEIRKEKHTKFLNLKMYEEQADQIDLSQRNVCMYQSCPN